MPHVVDIPRMTAFTFTTERLNQTFAGAGKHTFWDLPVGDDISSVWLMANGISRIKLEIDGDVLYDMDRASYEAYLLEKGRDPAALGGHWYLDLHAEGKAVSMASLDLPAERRRDARVKLDIVTQNASTAVEFLVTHADLYQKIR